MSISPTNSLGNNISSSSDSQPESTDVQTLTLYKRPQSEVEGLEDRVAKVARTDVPQFEALFSRLVSDLGFSSLHQAIALEKSVEEIAPMIDEETIDDKTKAGETPLHLALMRNRSDVAALLIDRGASVTEILCDNKTTLYLAAEWGDVEIARKILEKAPRLIDIRVGETRCDNCGENDRDLEGALRRAIKNKHSDLANYLIGASHLSKICCINDLVEAFDNDREEVFNFIINSSAFEEIDNLAELESATYGSRHYLIFVACYHGHPEAARTIFEKIKPDPIEVLDKIMISDMSHQNDLNDSEMEFIGFLIDQNEDFFVQVVKESTQDTLNIINEIRPFDVNTQDQNGNTLLMLALQRDRFHNATCLISLKADVNVQNTHGETALHLCTDADIARRLIRIGANPNLKDDEGDTPLHRAVFQESKGVVLELLEVAEDVNARNNLGESPLDITLMRNADLKEMRKTLLENLRVNPNAVNEEGETALHLAASSYIGTFEPLYDILDSGKFDSSARTNEGKTFVHYLFEKIPVIANAMFQSPQNHRRDPIQLLRKIARDYPQHLTQTDNDGNTPMTHLENWKNTLRPGTNDFGVLERVITEFQGLINNLQH